MLEDVYLADEFFWLVVSSMLHHRDHTFQDGSVDDLCEFDLFL